MPSKRLFKRFKSNVYRLYGMFTLNSCIFVRKRYDEYETKRKERNK